MAFIEHPDAAGWIPIHNQFGGRHCGIGGGTGGILIRANPVAGEKGQLPAEQKSTSRWLNTRAFVAPPAFQFGALGRNTVIGPSLVNVDFSVARKFRITERVGTQLRAEFFNLPNHPNFNLGAVLLTSQTLGAS